MPVSALAGDNVVTQSANMSWFHGQPLLGHLEDVHIASDRNLVDNRFPVQYVIRPQSADYRDYRGFAGSVARTPRAPTSVPAASSSRATK